MRMVLWILLVLSFERYRWWSKASRWNTWIGEEVGRSVAAVEVKLRLLTRRFRSSVFCGREELLVVRTLTFLTFKIFYMHKNLNNTLTGRKMHYRSPKRAVLEGLKRAPVIGSPQRWYPVPPS